MKRRSVTLGAVAMLAALAGCGPEKMAEANPRPQEPPKHPPRWRVNPEWVDAPLAEVWFNDRVTLVLNRECDWNAMGAKFTGRRYVPNGLDSFTGEIRIVEVPALIKR